MIRTRCLAALLALSACTASGSRPASKDAQLACHVVVFEQVALTECIADPTRHGITTELLGPDGQPYRSLTMLAANSDPTEVAFAMNAGMFDDAGLPIGYYVQSGERRHVLNRNDGNGNFHLMPNGVFFGTGSRWAVLSAEAFEKRVHRRPDFATQSGPMLVIDGELHPRIDPDGASLKLRNAVGVDRAGRAHFVVTDEATSFGKLARYFRDQLHVDNALFLDGSVSSLWDPVVGRLDQGPPLGPLIVVRKTAKAQPEKAAP